MTVAAFVIGITVATAAMPMAQWSTVRPAGTHNRGD